MLKIYREYLFLLDLNLILVANEIQNVEKRIQIVVYMIQNLDYKIKNVKEYLKNIEDKIQNIEDKLIWKMKINSFAGSQTLFSSNFTNEIEG